MKIAAIVSMVLAALGVGLAFVPCLGWLNWLAVPFCLAPLVLGVLGLVVDKDPATGRNPNANVYIACIVVAVMLCGFGALRCVLGGGVM
jgi:hypothetical protein